MSSSHIFTVSRDAERSAPRPRRRAPHGISLVEMMVVIGLSALLLGVATTLLFSLRDRDRRVRDDSQHADQLLRLAESLRTDIRRGNDVLLSVDGPLVVVAPDGTQTRYELAREGCQRFAAGADGSPARKDLFAVGRAAVWRVERVAEGRRPLVEVTLEQRTETGALRPAPMLVYAAMGADLPPPRAAEPEQE